MSRPVARPVALPRRARNAASQATFQPDSAGKDCASGSSVYLTASRLDQIASELSDRDRAVLGFVADCRLATSRQLVRRFWTDDPKADPARARAGRRALKRLDDWRVLEPLPGRAQGGVRGGSATMIYAIGLAGRKLVEREGLHLRRLGVPGERFRRHVLACTELVVDLHAADRNGVLELIQVQTEPACHRAFLGAWGARLWLRPDLFLRIGAGALEDRWWVEIDMGSEHVGALTAKLERYLAHYRSGSEQREHGIYPRVAWGVPDERRANQLQAVIQRLPEPDRGLFVVCHTSELVGRLAGEARS